LWAAPEGHFLAPLCGFRPRGLSAKTYNTFLPMSAASMYRHLNLGLRRHALVVAVACLGMSCPISLSSLHAQAAPAVDPRVTEAGAIEGTLFPPPDSHGKSAEGIKVTIDETGQSVDTDKHGKYSFENVKPGTYTLIASGSGYSRLRITDVVVKPNRTLTLNSEVMPMVMKDGEVQVMAEVVVNANKEIQTLEKLVVTDSNPAPFTDNFDLPRTKDDIQPYYMWDSTQIVNSGATNLQSFFQTMVPMDTNRTSYQSSSAGFAGLSNISLGGLGGNNNNTTGTQNTLILVDGLPQPSFVELGSTYQSNVNAIPLAAIDHIEVLPSSASAIYGANATGGVVNIILKHDYSGAELDYTYNNTFNTDSPVRTASLTIGESLEGGKTHLLLTASYQTEKPLLEQDRTQVTGPYEARYLSLYPGGASAFLGYTTSTGAASTGSAAVLLNTPIVRSSNGTPLIPGTAATQLQIPAGYQSFAANGLAPLQANLGNLNATNQNASTQGGLYGVRLPLTLGPMDKSIGLLLRRQFASWIEGFVQFSTSSEIGYSPYGAGLFAAVTVPANAPGNPFGQAVTVSSGNAGQFPPENINDVVTQNLSAGAKFTLPHDWRGELDYSWGATRFDEFAYLLNTAALQAAVTSGAVNVISDLSQYPLSASTFASNFLYNNVTSLDALQFKAAGPLVRLWAGSPTLAVGAGSQLDGYKFSESFQSLPGSATYGTATSVVGSSVYYPGQRDSHGSGYAELDIPLVGKANGIFGVRQLQLQAVGRYDNFEEFTTSPISSTVSSLANGTVSTSPNLLNGQPEPFENDPPTKYHATTGTVGFKYNPVDDLFFRWSFSTGFDAPTYNQLLGPISSGTQNEPTTPASQINPGVPTTSPWGYQTVTDPVLGSTYYVPVETGGNPNLKPETSHAIDWGVVFEPTFLRGLRIAVDYTKVTKYNDIVAPSTAVLIQYVSQFPGRVQRSSPTGPIVFINDTDINAPETFTSSYNIEVDYTFKTASLGSWKLTGIANSWQHYDVQSTVGGPFVEQLGNPYVSGGVNSSGLSTGGGAGLAKFKASLALDWSKGSFFAGWMAQYVGPYTEGAQYGPGGSLPYEVQTVNGWVSGQIYHNVYVGYSVGKTAPMDSWWRRALANSSIRLGVNNVFGHIPPFDGTTGFPALYSPYGSIRLASYIISVKKSL